MAQLSRNYAVVLCAVIAVLLVVGFFTPSVGPRIAAHLPALPSQPKAERPATPEHEAEKKPARPPPAAAKGFHGTWDAKRDARNLMFTADQCDAAFPGLFDDLDRMVEQTKKEGVVTRQYMNTIDSSAGDIGGCMIHLCCKS